MKILEQNEWILLDDIIYFIHSEENFIDERKEFLRLINYLIPNDFAVFHLADYESSEHILRDPVTLASEEKDFSNIINRYITEYEDEDIGKWMMMTGKGAVYRERDFISDDTIRRTGYYNDTYSALGVEYSLQTISTYNRAFHGAVVLTRGKSNGEFSDEEVFMMEILNRHLSLRLYHDSPQAKLTPPSGNEEIMAKIQNVIKDALLTRREAEVLEQLSKGISNDDMCESLCITNHTLRKHITNIYKKCNVNNRIQLMQKLWSE